MTTTDRNRRNAQRALAEKRVHLAARRAHLARLAALADIAAPGQMEFRPLAEGHGKYHRGEKVTGQAMCNPTIIVDMTAGPIVSNDGTLPHPICCRRCAAK